MHGMEETNQTMLSRHLLAIAAAVAGVALVSTSAQAAVTMIGTNTAGESWTTSADWSDNSGAHPGEDYIVGLDGSTPRTVRTPAGIGPQNFPGDSLTLAGGQLNLTADGDRINGAVAPGMNPYNTNTTIADLRVNNGGIIVNAVNSLPAIDTQYLHGSITFSGPTTNWIRTGGANTAAGTHRNIHITSQISGDGTVRVLQRGAVTLSGAGNTFSGTWHTGGTNVTVPGVASPVNNSAVLFTEFVAASDGALGVDSSVIVDVFSSLDVDYDWTTTGSLTLIRDPSQTNDNAPMILDQDITVGALTIGGVSIPDGVYSFAQLNTDYDLFFREGGSGSITVGVPEPASLAFVAMGGLLVLGRRRMA